MILHKKTKMCSGTLYFSNSEIYYVKNTQISQVNVNATPELYNNTLSHIIKKFNE